MPQYEFSTALSAELKKQHGPIIGNFQVTALPKGEAPPSIKQAWLHDGLLLPVRERALPGFPYYVHPGFLQLALEGYEETVAVSGGDALLALKNAGESEAVHYWASKLGKHALINPLFFDSSEGILTPSTTIKSLQELMETEATTAPSQSL